MDGLGSPSRIGLLLPLHWQTVTLLLAGVATGATVAVCADAEGLRTCDVAFVIAAQAGSAVDLGIDEVFALSGHPFGGPVSSLAPMAQDYSREVPSYADAWSGPAPTTVTIEVADAPLGDLPELPVTTADRVLVDVDLTVRHGLAALLSVLRSGASLVLAPSPHGALDLARTAADERVTATLGLSVPGLRALDIPP